MMKASYDLIGVGLVAVDILWITPPGARMGEKNNTPQMILQGGAPAGSGTCGPAMLGYQTGFLARLGDNVLSRIAREEFAARGVRSSLFVDAPGAEPALALVQIDPKTAERTVYYNLTRYQPLRAGDLSVKMLRDTRALLLDSFEMAATLAALDMVAGTPVRTILDLEHGDPVLIRQAIAAATDSILPWGLAEELTGKNDPGAALAILRTWTNGNLLVTDGVRGSWACDGQGIRHQPAFQVCAVDSTGCGDAYHGGYVVGVLEGWNLGMRMEFGAWMAAEVAKTLGGRTNLPSNQDLAKRNTDMLTSATRAAVRQLIAKTTSTSSLPTGQELASRKTDLLSPATRTPMRILSATSSSSTL